MERWVSIEEFPGYSVSDQGCVRNDASNYLLHISLNQYRVAYVGMTKDRKQYQRSVGKLVADAFLEPQQPSFTTPIHLDGDPLNNAVENLVLRPRWFAVKYKQQLHADLVPARVRKPIRNMDTGEVFSDSKECAMRYGILEVDLLLSIVNNTFVWPIYQTFQMAEA